MSYNAIFYFLDSISTCIFLVCTYLLKMILYTCMTWGEEGGSSLVNVIVIRICTSSVFLTLNTSVTCCKSNSYMNYRRLLVLCK